MPSPVRRAADRGGERRHRALPGRRLRRSAAWAQKGRDAVRAPQAHRRAGTLAVTRPVRCSRRVPPRRHRPKPPETRNADPDAKACNSHLIPGGRRGTPQTRPAPSQASSGPKSVKRCRWEADLDATTTPQWSGWKKALWGQQSGTPAGRLQSLAIAPASRSTSLPWACPLRLRPSASRQSSSGNVRATGTLNRPSAASFAKSASTL